MLDLLVLSVYQGLRNNFENYPKLSILKSNLKSLNQINNYEIVEKDIFKTNLLENLKEKFDIIF